MVYAPKRPPLDPCPVEEVLALIGGKWKARILLLLLLEPRGFGLLRRALPGVSQQVLSTQLQALVDDGLVARDAAAGEDAGSRYELTARGRSLIPVLEVVAAWGQERLQERGQRWERPKATLAM